MFIKALTVKAVLGVKETSTIECGRITEIKGKNGSGKTTLMEAFKASLGGGNLANIQNVDSEDEPETVLVLDDGALRILRKGKDTKVERRVGETAAYEAVKKPQTFVDALFDTDLSNPIKFLTANANARADLLLEVLAPELDVEALKKSLGADLWPHVRAIVAAGGHPLNVLAAARQTLYAERTGVNGAREDKARTVNELRLNIPAHLPEEVESNLPALEQERDAIADKIAKARAHAGSEATRIAQEADSAYNAEEARISSGFKADAAKIRQAAEQRVSELSLDAERRISAIKQQLAADLADIREKTEKEVAELKSAGEQRMAEAYRTLSAAIEAAEKARVEIQKSIEPDEIRLMNLTTEIAKQREQAERLIEVRKHKELADRLEGEAKTLHGKAERLTAGIKAVDVFKAAMLNGLPIEGLEVEGKEIRINGVPFDQLNTAKRIEIAVHVAALRAKKQKLPVLFIDGAEALDQTQYELLLQAIDATGCQAIVSRVSDGPLEVTTRESATA